MTINPFHFNLKKVRARDGRLLSAIYEFLPATGMREKFGVSVSETITKQVGEECLFRLEMVEYETFDRIAAGFSANPVALVIGMQPFSNKMLLELDPIIAMSAVERMLGGTVRGSFEMRKLTDTEQGVLQYLLMDILAAIHNASGKDARVHFRFERFAFHQRDIDTVAAASSKAAVFVLRVSLGAVSGFARLVIPELFAEEALLNVKASGTVECAYERGQLSRFGHVKTDLTAEAGRTLLSRDDIAGLEEGDIVLFEQGDTRLGRAPIDGRLVLRVGLGLHGGIDASVAQKDGKLSCTVIGVHKGD